MGLCGPLAVVRVAEDGGADMAHSEGMESHASTMRLSLSLSLPVSGETAGATGGGGGWDYTGELGFRRSLAVDDWRVTEDCWAPETGGDPGVDSNSSAVGLGVSLPVDGGITVHCGTIEAGGETRMDGNPSTVGFSGPLAVDAGIAVDSSSHKAGGETGMDGNPSAVGFSGPLAVVEMVRSAAVTGGRDGTVRSHSSKPRPGVLTVESVGIWKN